MHPEVELSYAPQDWKWISRTVLSNRTLYDDNFVISTV